ncbi:MAG: DUF488 domain-containing protein [Thermoplasmatota archaeon]
MGDAELFTIGYEGRSQQDVLGALRSHGIQTLMDVRIRPNSRKPGLSKTRLAAACQDAGIGYEHDMRLGTPIEILDAYKDTGEYDWDAYRAFLDTQTDAVEALSALATRHRVALLCYEADAGTCHRRFVASEAAGMHGGRVIHI